MGSRKAQTVGYRYRLGLHMGVARGPLDELVEIQVGDRTAWRGSVAGNRQIRIQAPTLFGGDDGEGGIDGTLDVLMGAADQPVHVGLAAMLGGVVPAFRGVATLFFRGMVCANNPYPKPWKLRVRRAVAGWDGPTWYPERAVIALESGAIRAMNPAHILVECLTNRDWGRGLDRGRLDEASYRAAADRLHGEGFGLCLRWTRQATVADFMAQVLTYVGGTQYVDRRTGLLRLKLLRDDYDPALLPLFDYESGLLGIDEDDAAAGDGAVNQVIVAWRNPIDNAVRHVREQALGQIQVSGGVNSTTLELHGLPTGALAARVARREVRVAAAGLKRLKIRLDRRGDVLAPGDVFRIRDPFRGFDPLVLRAVTIDSGTLENGTITLTALQDVFGLPATGLVDAQPPQWTPPSPTPQLAPHRLLFELSYRDLAGTLDAANLDRLTPEAGYLAALVHRPAGAALNYRLTTRVGNAAFADRGLGDWCPSAILATELAATSTQAALTAGSDLDQVEIGSAAWLGSEVVRIDGMDAQAQTVTLARGCADTVPVVHPVGTRLWCFDDFATPDSTEYARSEAVQAKLLTRTSSLELDPALAPIDRTTLVGRQARPYPPARLRINSQIYPVEVVGPLTVEWAHRDRLLQADQLIDTNAASIGPEVGSTVTLRLREGTTLLSTTTGLSGARHTVDLPGAMALTVELESIRNELASWQALRHTFTYSHRVRAVDDGFRTTDQGVRIME